MPKPLILCNCADSQPINVDTLESVDGVVCSKVHSGLCTHQADMAASLIKTGDAIIACAQERVFFEELAGDLGVSAPDFLDLRDRAGWSDEAKDAGPKMAALLTDSLSPAPATKTFDVSSDGLCLILGAASVVEKAAQNLRPHLNVSTLLEPGDTPFQARGFDVIAGTLKHASGSLGNFDVKIDALQQLEPGGRGALEFGAPRDGAQTQCDIILDLRGGTSLFPAPEKRDGYLRADPNHPDAVAAAILEASHLIGTFEKPLYLSLNPSLCAHSRAEQTGCSKCLDICPTSAILPAGDHVDINPSVCAGCGACAALCPSGAISYDDPTPDFLFQRMSRLAEAYIKAGGTSPKLLVHDKDFGSELIGLAARFERGLPADVIPMDLERVSGFGHAEMLAALACGFSRVDVLKSPHTESDALQSELALAQAMTAHVFELRILDPNEPSALCEALYDAPLTQVPHDQILPLGTRRQVSRLAVKTLRPNLEEPVPLPAGAPYGAVLIDTDACTLCLSCASLCPSGALGDNPEMPQLRFQEDACLQCGLCTKVCPENAITLVPQLDTSDGAFTQRVLHEEEPFPCVECGKLFGVKSTIEKVAEKLEGKHELFATSDAARMIRMCDDCRVNAQFHQTDNPFAQGERPRVRTSDDYFSKRRDH